MYSIRVDSDDHSFLAGGFVNHNTECRLHPLAMQLLADIDEDTVDLIPNYDGSTEEPRVLPARFPNLLVNGSQGIAVGMATNIPPHNLGEVIDATIHLIDHPEATPDDLMQFVKGPDFPTGGQHPRPGRDHRRLPHRARQHQDAGHGDDRGGRKGGRPRSSSPSCRTRRAARRSPARIQELVDGGDLDGIADVNDASAGGKTELVITLKRDANANVVLNNLFKLTQLQTSFASTWSPSSTACRAR